MPRIAVERIIVGFIIITAILLSISQTILYAGHTPLGAVYPLVHNFVEDYYQYLDIMRQGYDGWWTATSRLTPELLPRMPVSLFLLLLGHLARLFHVSLPVMYAAARVGGGIALMALVYQLIRKTFPQSSAKRFITFCIVLFSTYSWGWWDGGPIVATLPHAWTELDPIFRWSFVPHHLWSKVGMLAVFLLMVNPWDQSKRFKYILLMALLVLVMGLANPVVYVTFIPTIILYSVLTVHIKPKLSFEIGGVMIAVAVAGFVTLYHRYLQTNIFPWTSYLLWEKTLLYKVNPLDYAVSLGPTLILFVLAIPTLWRLGMVGRLFISWAASSWIMLYIVGPFVPVTPERYLGGYQFIPLGTAAAVWLFSLKGSHPALPAGRPLRLGCIVLLLGYFTIGLFASFTEAAGYVAANRNNPQVYVPKELMDAFAYLSTHGSSEDVVMAPYEISTMTPALTGRRVLAGHAMFTKDVAVKKALINDFFVGKNPVLPIDTAWLLAPSSFAPPQNFPMTKKYSNGVYTIFEMQ